MFCKNCGKENDSNAKFCAFCGCNLGEKVKEKTTTAEEPKESTENLAVEETEKAASESNNELDKVKEKASEIGNEIKEKISSVDVDELKEKASKIGSELKEKVSNIDVDKVKDKTKSFAKKEVENYKNFKKLSLKQKIIRIAIPLLIFVIVLASVSGSSSLTVPYDNDTGAVLNMTLDEYTEKFGVTLDEICVENGGNAINFDLAPFWSNMVEPMTDYEENSGAKYTKYSAFLDGAHIGATIQGDKISHIQICFDYDENSFAKVSAGVTVMICGNMEFEKASEIIDTISNGIMDNTMIYKDGILYSIMSSTVPYSIMAASEEFVQCLEDSGNCNVLRW